MQSTQLGGMETYCVALAREFVRRGVLVRVVVPEDGQFNLLASDVRSAGARVDRLDTDARHGRRGQIVRGWRLLRLLRSWRPDVVHLHTGGATGGLAVLAAARFVTRAAVVLGEYDVPSEHVTRRQRLAKRASEKLSGAVVVTSRKLAVVRSERLKAAAADLAVVPTGAAIRKPCQDEQRQNRLRARRELDIAPDVPVLGTVVRLVSGKGVETLIAAFATLRARFDCRLVIVGDGEQREELASMACALGIGRDIRFAGFQADPTPFMDSFDVFALAVPVGSGSIALLEAMSRGLPAVITFGGPEEPVVDGVTGYAVPPSRPADLAEAIRSLLDDDVARARMGAEAASYVLAQFSIERAADDLQELYGAVRKRGVPARLRAGSPPVAPSHA